MKQKGQVWFDNKGLPTASKHVPNYDRICETLGQRLAAAAEDIETRIIENKQKAKEVAEQILKLMNATQGSKETKVFSFYVYDKSFRFEVDVATSNMRVYRAIKDNPSHQDYELLHMDWSKPLKAQPVHETLIIETPAPAGTEQPEPVSIESAPDIVRED